jgi:hypothetical protein
MCCERCNGEACSRDVIVKMFDHDVRKSLRVIPSSVKSIIVEGWRCDEGSRTSRWAQGMWWWFPSFICEKPKLHFLLYSINAKKRRLSQAQPTKLVLLRNQGVLHLKNLCFLNDRNSLYILCKYSLYVRSICRPSLYSPPGGGKRIRREIFQVRKTKQIRIYHKE